MSRIGVTPITLSDKVSLKVTGNLVEVKGPLGELKQEIMNKNISVEIDGSTVTIENSAPTNKTANSAHGLYRQLIANMVAGVEKVFTKKLIVCGVGYRASVQGNKLVLTLGY